MENCKEWLNIKEAAEYLGISYGRLSTLINDGVYPVSLVPGFKKEQRLSRSKLDEMLRETEHKKEERRATETVGG
jgi:excisionase family DNA binding protein